MLKHSAFSIRPFDFRRLAAALIFTVAIAGCAIPNPEISPVVSGSGLVCATVRPTEEKGPSCDKLCAAQGMACTGVSQGPTMPAHTCGEPASATWDACRCCAVKP